MREGEEIFLTGLKDYLKSVNVKCYMQQDFSIHYTDPVIGFNVIWVQKSYNGKPYIHSYIGYCFAKAGKARAFEEELEETYPDYKFYADPYDYKYEIGLSQEFDFVSYEDVYTRILKMEEVIVDGYVMGKEWFGGNFER